jgi:hypothetical protein
MTSDAPGPARGRNNPQRSVVLLGLIAAVSLAVSFLMLRGMPLASRCNNRWKASRAPCGLGIKAAFREDEQEEGEEGTAVRSMVQP